ncbi:MAG: HAMP domain-containing histidine kinase [Lachnospiraceae bacterium]|nr:HAMP domain-containing histidine kinase [Lachnospiraceae bacterium]
MRRRLFDKVLLMFLLVSILSFAVLFIYTTYQTREMLINEKQDTLYNEALLISKQTVLNYITGVTSKDLLIAKFNEFEDDLKTKIWYMDTDGNIVAMSHRENYNYVPSNIHELDSSGLTMQSFSMTGQFYNIFPENMITIGIPIEVNNKRSGQLILHANISQFNGVQQEMFTIAYAPYAIFILLSFMLITMMTKNVFRPLGKMNEVARAYAKGDFDAKTGIESKDELGELAESLEYMAGELSKLDEYRKNFISNISHDFRSPLTSIKGYIEAMMDGTIPPEKQERYFKIVLSETKRLTKLTEGLLELNKFDSANLVLKITGFDITDVIRSTMNTFEGTCEKKWIKLNMTCLADDTEVAADKAKIQQVVYNLLDNAIKFSNENSRIDISITEKKDKIFVSVKDYGIGIKKESQGHVFDRFYKSDSSRGKDKQGTGLGLSITKEIIKAHGEEITLVSTEGVGTEFVFSLTKVGVGKTGVLRGDM